MINKAIRTSKIDVLYRFRSYTRDLYHQIQDESTSESITVYFGQTIERRDLDDIQKNLLTNDLLIFPKFLFGSTDEERAIRVAKEILLLSEEHIPLLIRMDISEDFKCATLNSRRYAIDEDSNVLLNVGAMGRLIRVETENTREDHMASIHLRLVKSEEQGNIQQILETTRAELKDLHPFVGIIKLLLQVNEQSLAEQTVQIMFDDQNLESDESLQVSIAFACNVLAQSRRSQEDYTQALAFYLLSMKAFRRTVRPNVAELSTLYSSIAAMYLCLGNYEKSREFYQAALDTELHSDNPNIYSVGIFNESIGTTYYREEKYPTAIRFFERTLKIFEQCSEPHDDALALNYEELGDAYYDQMKYDQALEYYTKAFEIYDSIVPRNPQTSARVYMGLGNINMNLDRSKTALTNFQSALKYFQQFLPLAHERFAFLYNNMGLMYYQEGAYCDALSCYDKSLEISPICLPDNDLLVGTTLFNMANVYASQDRLDEAIRTAEKSTAQYLKTLPKDHSKVIDNQKFIEAIRCKKILKEILTEETISI